MLQQSNFLLQILRVVCKGALGANVLSIAGSSLVVVEMMTSRVKNNLCAIVKENSSSTVVQKISQSIFGRIVDPLLNPNLGGF